MASGSDPAGAAAADLMQAASEELLETTILLRRVEAAVAPRTMPHIAGSEDSQLIDLVIQTLEDLAPLLAGMAEDIAAARAPDAGALISTVQLADLRARLCRNGPPLSCRPEGTIEFF